MVVTASIFELRGGARIAEVEPAQLSWSFNGNNAETVDMTINLNSKADSKREWRNLASAWNHGIAVPLGGGRYAGGPILPQELDDDGRTLKVTARGLRVALAHHYLMPVSVLTTNLVDVFGVVQTSADSVFANVDYGTIGKKIVQQACTWPSWSELQISYHADRAGRRMQSYAALDYKTVDAALSDISELENGPDIRLDLVEVGDDNFGWQYRSGTEDAPRLQAETVFEWEIGRASGLHVTTNPTRMASVAWSVGGRSSDQALVALQYDPYLVNMGGLLLQMRTDADANESEMLNLQKYNAEALRTARQPWEFWSFKVPADTSPFPFEYGPGDLCNVIVTKAQRVAGGWVGPGTYQRRIAAMAGDEKGRYVTITCGENYG